MGQAREVLDRLTAAVVSGDFDTLAACYAEDAVAVTPDEGEIKGRDNIVGYFRPLVEAFPDIRWEGLHSHESQSSAIDEGYICGTHTAPLHAPNGQTVPPTGKTIRVRETDAVTVEGGVVTSHRFYFDQMDLLGQLGLL